MRAFIALPLPGHITSELSRVQNGFYLRNVKLSYVKDFHLTLKFLGDIDDRKRQEIDGALRNVIFSPFDVSGFPTKRKPRVIWAGLKESTDVIALQQRIDAGLASLGFTKENDYTPHITLARVKYIENTKKFEEMLDHLTLQPEKMDMGSFCLFKSDLTPEGPSYTELHRYLAHS